MKTKKPGTLTLSYENIGHDLDRVMSNAGKKGTPEELENRLIDECRVMTELAAAYRQLKKLKPGSPLRVKAESTVFPNIPASFTGLSAIIANTLKELNLWEIGNND